MKWKIIRTVSPFLCAVCHVLCSFYTSTYIHKCKKNKVKIKEQYKFLLEQSYCIKSFTNANLHAINGRQRIWCKNITWIWIKMYKFVFLLSCQHHHSFLHHHHKWLDWTPSTNTRSFSWGFCNLQGSRSSLMLSMLFGLVLRPKSMSSQNSVQELLRHWLSSPLLRGDGCSVHQCFPFILCTSSGN